jgi:hypothetical protein
MRSTPTPGHRLIAAVVAACFCLPGWAKDKFVSDESWGRVLIAADPQRPERLAIGGTAYECDTRMAVHLSTDGGAKWNMRCLPEIEFSFANESPAVAYDANGDLLALVSVSDEGDLWHTHATRSTDGGRNWAPWTLIDGRGRAGVGDSHLYVDDQPRSGFKGTLYATYDVSSSEIRVAHSRDGGARWTSVAASVLGDEDTHVGFGDLAIGRDGRLFLSYLTCDGFNCVGRPGQVQLVRSADGGASWSAPIDVAAVQQPKGAGFWGGLPRTSSSLSFTPAVAVDTTKGPHKGALYIVTTTFDDKRLQVLTTRSEDGGKHWTVPQPVSATTADQFMPTISVGPQGVVAVTWLDRRNDPEGLRYQPMVAFSRDGGHSFGEPRVLDADLADPSEHYVMAGSADHTWAGDRLQVTFLGKGKRTAITVRANSARP